MKRTYTYHLKVMIYGEWVNAHVTGSHDWVIGFANGVHQFCHHHRPLKVVRFRDHTKRPPKEEHVLEWEQKHGFEVGEYAPPVNQGHLLYLIWAAAIESLEDGVGGRYPPGGSEALSASEGHKKAILEQVEALKGLLFPGKDWGRIIHESVPGDARKPYATGTVPKIGSLYSVEVADSSGEWTPALFPVGSMRYAEGAFKALLTIPRGMMVRIVRVTPDGERVVEKQGHDAESNIQGIPSESHFIGEIRAIASRIENWVQDPIETRAAHDGRDKFLQDLRVLLTKREEQIRNASELNPLAGLAPGTGGWVQVGDTQVWKPPTNQWVQVGEVTPSTFGIGIWCVKILEDPPLHVGAEWPEKQRKNPRWNRWFRLVPDGGDRWTVWGWTGEAPAPELSEPPRMGAGLFFLASP